MILNYTTRENHVLYNFFMVIISVLNLTLSILLNYMLFTLVGATINRLSNKYLILVLSILGGVILATLRLFMLPRIGLVVIIAVLFACSATVLFYPQKLISFIILQLVVLAYILAGSGVGYLLQLLFFNVFELTYTTYTIFGFVENIMLLLLGAFITCLFKLNYRKKEILDFVFDVMIELAGVRVVLKMLVDSGNMLYDEDVTGLPIIVVNKEIFEKKLGFMVVEDECRRVQFTTIGGDFKSLAVIEVDNIFIINGDKTKRIFALVGFVDKEFKIYDGLLHSSVA